MRAEQVNTCHWQLCAQKQWSKSVNVWRCVIKQGKALLHKVE